MNIKKENRTELVDVGHDKITQEFSVMTDKILAYSQPILRSGATGIGASRKFAGMGIYWKVLKAYVFKLIDDGIITKYVDKNGITRVDLNGLESIEVGIINKILINSFSLYLIRKIKQI